VVNRRSGTKRTWRVAAACAAFGCWVGACSSESTRPDEHVAGTPATVAIVSGDGQVGVVGALLPRPVSVAVKDSAGRPVPKAVVGFTSTAEQIGPAESVVTDESGVATVRTLRFPTKPGVGHPAAEVFINAGGTLSITLSDTAKAGPPASLALHGFAPSLVEQMGATIVPPPFVVRDTFGNAVPRVNVVFSSNRSGSSVAGAQQLTDSLGRAGPTSWTVGSEIGFDTLTAAVGALRATLTAFVASGPLATLVVGDGDKQQGGVALVARVHPSVAAHDAAGRGVPNVRINWSDGAVGRVRCSSVTDANGGAFLDPCQWRFGDSPGTDTLIASAGSARAVFTAMVLAPPASLVFLSPAPNTTFFKLTSPSIDVRVQLRQSDGGPAAEYQLQVVRHSFVVTFDASIVTDSLGTATIPVPLGVFGQDTIGVRTTVFPMVSASLPIDVVGPVPFIAIASGGSHTCGAAVETVANSFYSVYCWGSNANGQLGDGSSSPRRLTPSITPLVVDPADELAALSLGAQHSCTAVLTREVSFLGTTFNPTAYCWGSNSSGQAGVNGQSANSPTAVGPSIGNPAAGATHTCGVMLTLSSRGDSERAVCWGDNSRGELGDGTTISRSTPALVDTSAIGSDVRSIAAGAGFSCAVQGAGAAYCWGRNDVGQLGDGTTTDRLHPVPGVARVSFAPVDPVSGEADRIVAGDAHVCVLTLAGAAYCWGGNTSGQLGDGTSTSRSSAAPVAGGMTFASISAGGSHTCALTADGTAYCWGSNAHGELGTGNAGSFAALPQAVTGGLHFWAIAAGESHTCALLRASGPANRTAYCWGLNDNGQLGDGTTTSRFAPVPVAAIGAP
jgi:alpha-tubulin suppressor-like RCC1 family protein